MFTYGFIKKLFITNIHTIEKVINNFPNTRIPFNLNDGIKLMSKYIEPLLKNLEQYLVVEDKKKLVKPWD